MEKNKKRLIAAAIIMCLLISLIFTSCKRLEDDEAKAIISNLLDRSYTLNQIYFGEGLSYNEDEEEITGYCMASDDEPMNTKEAIVKETNIVFSEKIASHLIKTYFEGIESYKVAEYARYIETDIGKVLVVPESAHVKGVGRAAEQTPGGRLGVVLRQAKGGGHVI